METEVVFEHTARRACAERALVLESLGIPNEIVHDGVQCVLVVPAEFAEQAKYELWQYDEENRNTPRRERRIQPVYQNAVPGVAAYALIVLTFAWISGESLFGYDWIAAGRVDGILIRAGEWWRAFTALTLHSGLRHLLGNIGFGVLFGILAGRLAGPGVAWLGIVIAAGAANLLNTILLESTHRSIGASTAVFAALGFVAGFVWRAKLMAQDRWAFRLGPIVGGLALLAYTGSGGNDPETGENNTDVGAHLAGFICGFAVGMLMTTVAHHLERRTLQIAAGAATIVIITVTWIVALRP